MSASVNTRSPGGLQDRNIGMALGLEYRFARFINKQKKAREAHATDSCMHLRRPRCAAGDPLSALAENSKEGRADQGWSLRRLRYRSDHTKRPLAEPVDIAVTAWTRAESRFG